MSRWVYCCCVLAPVPSLASPATITKLTARVTTALQVGTAFTVNQLF